MILSAIVAASRNHVIGRNNRLPWRLPADLRYFKNTTWGMPVVMGRKTYESVNAPLPGRLNIVVTTNPDWKADGVLVAHNLTEAIRLAAEAGTKEIFITGGAEIFRQSFSQLERIYITRIMTDVEGDTYFPPIPEMDWELRKNDLFRADDKNPFDYAFQIWERKSAQV